MDARNSTRAPPSFDQSGQLCSLGALSGEASIQFACEPIAITVEPMRIARTSCTKESLGFGLCGEVGTVAVSREHRRGKLDRRRAAEERGLTQRAEEKHCEADHRQER